MVALNRSVGALAAAIAFMAAPQSAAQRPPDPCTSAIANPADVSMQLSLKDGQTVFHEGEVIALTVGFSSTAGNKYVLNMSTYDRSGRLDAETFCIEPAVARDPLDEYFHSGLWTLVGGGLFGSQVLSATPAFVDVDVNEWRALPPGHYRVRVTSDRVSGQPAPGTFRPGAPVPVVSNIVELDVVAASPDWQRAQFDAAIAAIDAGATDAAKRRGARTLRFLDSDASVRELARRYWAGNDQPFGWEFMFGLIASTHRQTAVDALRTALVDPMHAVTTQFVQTLALLEIQADRTPAAYQEAVARHLREVAAVLDSKTDQARAICLNTLLINPGAADPARLRHMLPSSWDFLPIRMRDEILQSRWNEVGGPDLLPILRRIVDGPPSRRGGPDQPDRGAALSRLYEISPQEGRELILHEILDVQGDIRIQVLGSLSDRELPEVDAPLMARLRQRIGSSDSQVVAFQLVDRYATAKPLAELRGIYEHRGRWACAQQAAMLRYFLRVDQPYGIAEVGDALRQRAVTGCYHVTFGDLGEAVAIPDVERLAIAALEDASEEVVRDAAASLRRYGSPAAEAPLWRRLEKLHQDGSVDGNMVEYDLMTALADGQAWVCDSTKLERLRPLVSPSRQPEVDWRVAEWQRGEFQLLMNWPGDGRVVYRLDRYTGGSIDELAKKLKQFPAGSKVVLSLSAETAARHPSDLEAVRLAASSAGVTLEVRK
jgi:hypothetical protein